MNRFLTIILFVLSINLCFAEPFTNHIVDVSTQFLNKPYIVDPLGEGPQGKYSQKLLYRFDGFDCQTYVETVLALALSHNTQQFQEQLFQIRYSDGKPNFLTRNHFPSIDWIPNNIKKKYITYSDLNTDKISLIINKRQWLKDKINVDDPDFPGAQKVTLPYISVAQLPQVANKIPNGAIIMIVRPSFLLITHMGFAVWKEGVLYYREASSLRHKVMDVHLLRYVEYESQYGVKGIVVLIPQNKK